MFNKNRSTLRFLSVVLLVFVLTLVFIAWRSLSSPLNIPPSAKASFVVMRGTTSKQLAQLLYQQNLYPHPLLLLLYARVSGFEHHMQAGEYAINHHLSVLDLLSNIAHGHVVVHHVRFLSGWTFAHMRKVLARAPVLKHTIHGLKGSTIMALLKAQQLNPEGWFYPNTYNYVWGDTDLHILKEAYNQQLATLQTMWAERAKNVSYKNMYQALIVASMIEKETAVASERHIIAGVILRRLHKGMRLQIDPTVVYGLHKPYGYQLTREDLRHNTPYNTYRHYGLPPTPICMPSKASIMAALHPDHGNALYYVAKGDGTHQFSDTYAQQRKAIEKYIFHKP